MRTDGQTDVTKILVDFRNFAEAPKRRARARTHTHTHTHISIHIRIYYRVYIYIYIHTYKVAGSIPDGVTVIFQ